MEQNWTPAYASQIEQCTLLYEDEAETDVFPAIDLATDESPDKQLIAAGLALVIIMGLVLAVVFVAGKTSSDEAPQPMAYQECQYIKPQKDQSIDDYLLKEFNCESGIAVEALYYPDPNPKRRASVILGETITPLNAGVRPSTDPLGLCYTILGGTLREVGPSGDNRIVAVYELPPKLTAEGTFHPNCKGGEVTIIDKARFG